MNHYFYQKSTGACQVARPFIMRLLVWGCLVLVLPLLMPATEVVGAEELICGICGEPIVAGRYIRHHTGQNYHKKCFEQSEHCVLCSRPIEKGQETTSLSGDRVCHQFCFNQAKVCGICDEPICAGERHRTSRKTGETYHLSCFDSVPKCGLTGQPITPGAASVRIGDETFLKAAYDKSKKCLVSGLPVTNHGRCLVNSRTKTYVLEKFQHQTRECYSCGDHLVDGFAINNDLFLCRYCYEKGIRNRKAAKPYIDTVTAFFRQQGVTVPDNLEIRILPPGQLIEENRPGLKGRCHINGSSKNGEPATLSYTVEFLWGLNQDVFAGVAAHELSHAVIGEALFDRMICRKPEVPYEEGRCEYTAYTFARSRGLPDYIIEGFAENQVDNYREEFLYVRSHPPESIKKLLTSMDF